MDDMIYVTAQGDMWDSISFALWGSTRYRNRLMAANPQLLGYYVFPVGIELKVPEILKEQAALSIMPPWRQVV